MPGSARWARPVMPGAWLQTPAKTRLISVAEGASYAGDLFLGRRRHGVDACEQRAVRAEDVKPADVAAEKCLVLFGSQVVAVEQRPRRFAKSLLHRRLAVQVVEELLRAVETHASSLP